MKKTVTIQEIADCCQVSKSTAAYILRTPETCVAKAETKAKVLECARQMHYQRNPAARALSTRKYRTFGLLFPMLAGHYGELITAIVHEMNKYDYNALVVFWEKDGKEKSLAKLLAQGIDGLITFDDMPELAAAEIPTVLFGNPHSNFDSVFPDKQECMLQAVDYLKKNGHHAIGCAGYRMDSRYEFLKKALKKYELPFCREYFFPCEPFRENGAEALDYFMSLEQRPTALILHSDLMMSGIVSHAAACNLKLPEALSIIGFDGLAESKFMVPALTTFSQRMDYAGKMLVEILLRRLENPELSIQNFSYKMTLIERSSVKKISPETME